MTTYSPRIELVLTGVRRRDIILIELAKVCGGEFVTKWDGDSFPIIVGNNEGCDEIQIRCRKEGKHYLYIDHAYFNRGYEGGCFRFCKDHYHTTDWRPSDKKIPKTAPWHEGDTIIVIPPAPMVEKIYNARGWLRETLDTLAQHTDKRIVIKQKGDGRLADMLKTAHALVSYGSVAEVEAALAGVPVFTTCGPSLPVAQTDFSKIETPIYPDREKWLSALAGAEWHLSELDKAWSRLYEHHDIRRTTDRSGQLAQAI